MFSHIFVIMNWLNVILSFFSIVVIVIAVVMETYMRMRRERSREFIIRINVRVLKCFICNEFKFNVIINILENARLKNPKIKNAKFMIVILQNINAYNLITHIIENRGLQQSCNNT